MSKAHVERARVALEEAKSTRRAKTFQFFDEAEDYVERSAEVIAPEPIDEPVLDEARASKRRFGLRRRGDDDPELDTSDETLAEQETAEPAPRPPSVPTGRSTPATTLIESGALASAPPGTLPASQLSPEASSPPDPGWPIDGEVTGSKLETAPSTQADDAEPTEHVTPVAPPADSLADRFRTRTANGAAASPAASPTTGQHAAPVDQPAPPAAATAADDLDADPFAPTWDPFVEPTPTTTPQVDLAFPAPSAAPSSNDPFATPATPLLWDATTPRAASPATPEPIGHAPAATDLGSDPFAMGDPFGAPAFPDSTPSAAGPASAAPAAPGPSHVAATTPLPPRQRAADQFQPPAEPLVERRSEPSPMVAPSPSRATPPPVAPPFEGQAPPVVPATPNPVPAASAVGPVANGATARAAADTDANGNWIPPLLRGMAPVEERRADQLPRRRQRD
ncbi:MAG: hypothetical protein R2710_03810 [Acidimicrobiales bacterium]